MAIILPESPSLRMRSESNPLVQAENIDAPEKQNTGYHAYVLNAMVHINVLCYLSTLQIPGQLTRVNASQHPQPKLLLLSASNLSLLVC
jgi:hypothetical protein